MSPINQLPLPPEGVCLGCGCDCDPIIKDNSFSHDFGTEYVYDYVSSCCHEEIVPVSKYLLAFYNSDIEPYLEQIGFDIVVTEIGDEIEIAIYKDLIESACNLILYEESIWINGEFEFSLQNLYHCFLKEIE